MSSAIAAHCASRLAKRSSSRSNSSLKSRIGLRRPALWRHRHAAPVSGPLCLTSPSSVSQAEVQPVELGIAALQPGDDAQRLGIVVEAAPWLHLVVERVLAGMAERRVAEIVDQRDRLGEILVAAQRARQGARDLRHLDRVGQPRAVVVALVRRRTPASCASAGGRRSNG